MYSFHLTGSAWYLLLLPPGLFILWRQYRGGTAAAFPGAGRLLFGLQALVLLVLVASLTRPELRAHRVQFHNPAVLVLRDQSSSFQGGGYLGLGGRYAAFQTALAAKYSAMDFDLRYVDFDERARRAAPENGGRAGDVRLTSMAALADFLDSAAVPNLQAAFLFSDGISNLDSGRGARSWKMPLYPVVFAPDSIAEVQPLRVTVLETGESPRAANPRTGTRAVEIEAWWRPVGKAVGGPELVLLRGVEPLMVRKLPVNGGGGGNASAQATDGKAAAVADSTSMGPAGLDGGIRKFRFRANLPIQAVEGSEPMRAIVRPAQAGGNFNTFNDTLDVAFSRGRARRTIHVLRPVRGLDEKGMVDMLSAWEGTRVVFFGMDDSALFSPSAEDQVWVEAGSVVPGGGIQVWLAGLRAKVVLYVRPGPPRNLQVPGLGSSVWRTYSPSAEIRAGRRASDVFPAEILRLKAVASSPISAPDAADGVEAWVEAREGGRRGMIMGPVTLGRGKRAFFFCLPAIWESLFDPQADFAVRENIAAYIRSAHALADRDDGVARVSLPDRAFDMVPFDIPIALPRFGDGVAPEAGAGNSRVFAISGEGYAREWPLPPGGSGEVGPGKIALPAGAYRMELRSTEAGIWRDSLRVAPKSALELARIGFDMESLGDAASGSGGSMVSPGAAGSEAAGVSSVLPDLEAAQIRAEKTRIFPLYNTLFQFLLVMLLLSLSWVLRKKWDID